MLTLIYPRTPRSVNNRIVRDMPGSCSKGKLENEQELLRKRAAEMYLPPGRLKSLPSTPIVVPKAQKPNFSLMNSRAKKYMEITRDAFETETYQYDLAVKKQLQNDMKQLQMNKKSIVTDEAVFQKYLLDFPSRKEAEDVLRTVEETNLKLQQIKRNYTLCNMEEKTGQIVMISKEEEQPLQYDYIKPVFHNPTSHEYHNKNPSIPSWGRKRYQYVPPLPPSKLTAPEIPQYEGPMTVDDLTIFAPVVESEPPWKQSSKKVPYAVMKNFTKQIIKEYSEPLTKDHEYFDHYQPVPIEHIPQGVVNKLFLEDPNSCYQSAIQVEKLVGNDLARNYDKPWLTNNVILQQSIQERQKMNERVKSRITSSGSKWNKRSVKSRSTKDGYSASAAISMGLKPLTPSNPMSTNPKLHQMKPPRPMLHELDKAKLKENNDDLPTSSANVPIKRYGYTPPVFKDTPWKVRKSIIKPNNANNRSTSANNKKSVAASAVPTLGDMKEQSVTRTVQAVAKMSKSNKKVLNSNFSKLSSKCNKTEDLGKCALDSEGNFITTPKSKRSRSTASAKLKKSISSRKNNNNAVTVKYSKEESNQNFFGQTSENQDAFKMNNFDVYRSSVVNSITDLAVRFENESNPVSISSASPRKRKSNAKKVKKIIKKLISSPPSVKDETIDLEQTDDDVNTPSVISAENCSRNSPNLQATELFDEVVKESQIATEEWVAYIKAKKRLSKRHNRKKFVPSKSIDDIHDIPWVDPHEESLRIEETKGAVNGRKMNKVINTNPSIACSAQIDNEPAVESKSLEPVAKGDSRTKIIRKLPKGKNKDKESSTKKHFNEINVVREDIKGELQNLTSKCISDEPKTDIALTSTLSHTVIPTARKKRERERNNKVAEYKEMRKKIISEIKHEVATVAKKERKYYKKLNEQNLFDELLHLQTIKDGNSENEEVKHEVIHSTIYESEIEAKELQGVGNIDVGTKAKEKMTNPQRDSEEKTATDVKQSDRKYKTRHVPGLSTVVEAEE